MLLVVASANKIRAKQDWILQVTEALKTTWKSVQQLLEEYKGKTKWRQHARS